MADWTPQSRAEEILFKTINGEPYDGLPQSRIEELLLELKDVIESGGGGGGGTDNYNLLKNLPQINGQTVKGNMSGTTLGLVNMVMGKDLSTNDYTNADKAIVNSVTADLADKVDKITGKGLSENDYTDADKAIVDGVTSALSDKVDKIAGKGLSTNDYDDTAKGIVDGVTTALAGKVNTSSVGSANGVAELDANGRVPSAQLPSYVDDTVEGYLNSQDGKFYADSAYTTEITGETGKIYVTLDTNKTYRWSGSGFVEISESLALGETSSTAYAGNKGKANADAIAAIKDGTNIDSFADVESAISAVDGKIAFPTISSGSANDIKGENVQVSKTNNYLIDTLLTSSSTSDADKVTIEWDGNNDVVRFRNYINNAKVKETTFMSEAQISLGEITAAGEYDFVSQVLDSLAALNLPENKTKTFDVSYSGVSLFSGLAEWVSSTVLFVFLFRSGYQYTASYNSSTQGKSIVKYTGTTVSPT